MSERCSFSPTTFSPPGQLVETEYALDDVAAGALADVAAGALADVAAGGQLVETEYALADVAAGALADVAAGGQPVETEYALTDVATGGQPVETEYALTDVSAGALADVAVAAGSPSVGIKFIDGVLLATKKQFSNIDREYCIYKIEMIAQKVGIVYRGMMDREYRRLVAKARELSQEYYTLHQEEIPTEQIVQRIPELIQEFTQHLVAKVWKLPMEYYKLHEEEISTEQIVQRIPKLIQEFTQLLVAKARELCQEYYTSYQEQIVQRITELIQEFTQPFGFSLLIAGWDDDKERPFLYQYDPSDAFPALNATDENYLQRKRRFEARCHGRFLEDAVYTAMFTLRDFKVQMTKDNIEIGIFDKDGLHRLTPAQMKHFLDNLP